ARVWLTMADGPDRRGWVRSSFAPELLFEPEPAPPAADDAWHSGGLTFRLAPPAAEPPGPAPASGAAASLSTVLQRLLLIPDDAWAVEVVASPVDVGDAEQYVADLETAEFLLGAHGGRQEQASPTASQERRRPDVD